MDFEIIDYSERAIAVFGNTQAIKDDLIALGGRFNPNLTVDGERRAGWIFSAKKRSKVEELCNVTSVPTTSNHTSNNSPTESKNNMEFHIAIKNILKYQGKDFLLDPKMVNALVDFQAYEFHPAMKNIFRTLHSDNYIAKIAQHSAWNASCDQLVYEVERDYAFPRDLIEYIFKSVAYGIGALSSVSVPNSNKQQQSCYKPSTFAKPWQKMTKEEKAEVIDGKIEVKQDSFRRFGLTLVSHSTFFDEFDNLIVVTELSGKCNSKDLIGSIMFSTYDENGKLRSSDESGWVYGEKYRGFQTDECLLEPRCSLEKISRITLYLREN